MKPQLSGKTEKTVSARGRKGRKSAKRRKRRRRSGKKNARRRRSGRGSARGRETETENGTAIETGGHAEATPTAATPVEHQTENGADPVIGGGPGAETRTERGNANAAGMADFIFLMNRVTGMCHACIKGQSTVASFCTEAPVQIQLHYLDAHSQQEIRVNISVEL